MWGTLVKNIYILKSLSWRQRSGKPTTGTIRAWALCDRPPHMPTVSFLPPVGFGRQSFCSDQTKAQSEVLGVGLLSDLAYLQLSVWSVGSDHSTSPKAEDPPLFPSYNGFSPVPQRWQGLLSYGNNQLPSDLSSQEKL